MRNSYVLLMEIRDFRGSKLIAEICESLGQQKLFSGRIIKKNR